MDCYPNPSHLLFTTIGNVHVPGILVGFRLGTTRNPNDDIDVDNYFRGMVSSLGIKLRKQHGVVHRSRHSVHLVSHNVFH